MIKLLFIGDIVGKPGRTLVEAKLKDLREELGLHVVIANGENSAGGAGINARIANELKSCGVDAITLGDHVWDQRDFEKEIVDLEHVCRPCNLPLGCPGRTHLILEVEGCRLGIFTALGRHYINLKAECPFLATDRMLELLEPVTDAILVEAHAEATSEKVALGWYLDGRVTAVLGTHTHIPTADGRVLPKGTAYLTDAGMTGAYESVLGREVQPVVARFLDGLPRKFPVAENDVRLCGCVVEFDGKTGIAASVERVEIRADR